MDSAIKVASKEDFPQIKEIWREIFINDNTYLSLVCNDLLPICKSYIYQENGKILSVATAIPAEIKTPEGALSYSESKRLNGSYLYGVATIKEARGRGLSKKITSEIINRSIATGEKFIITRPAEESLFGFYKSQGFTEEHYKEVERLSSPTIQTKNNKYYICARKLKRLREEYFIGELKKPLICWSEKFLQHAINITLLDSGETFYTKQNGQTRYCIATNMREHLLIEESSLSINSTKERKLYALINILSKDESEIRAIKEAVFNFPLE